VATGTDTITIPTWANGPDDSGNGGWSAGLLARQLGDAAIREGVAVNLRVPPPIGRPLRVARTDRGVDLFDDEAEDEPTLVAMADLDDVSLDVPSQVRELRPQSVGRAHEGFPFRTRHPFPRCVACGIARSDDEVALGLHCGPVSGVDVGGFPVFADTWTPAGDVADPADDSRVLIEACWSALDCPSAAPVADPDAANPIVLARIAARIATPARVGDEHVLAAWHVSSDGRKHVTRSVMLDGGGAVLAAADALWIEVRPR
jgi:hypothetical protein